MTDKTFLMLVLMTALIAGGVGYTKGYKDASGDYTALLIEERVTYAKTKTALQAAVATGLEWKVAYEGAQKTVVAFQETAKACLTRERDWQDALARQESVFRETVVHPRATEERDRVVDAATRKKAAALLNTAWLSAGTDRVRGNAGTPAGTSSGAASGRDTGLPGSGSSDAAVD